mgnify:CR=1 FL=1
MIKKASHLGLAFLYNKRGTFKSQDASNSTKEGMALNRRVEITILE